MFFNVLCTLLTVKYWKDIYHKYKFYENMIYQGDLMDNFEVEYIFNDNGITLDNILISILNSKVRVVDFDTNS